MNAYGLQPVAPATPFFITVARGDNLPNSDTTTTVYATREKTTAKSRQHLCVQNDQSAFLNTGYDFPTLQLINGPNGVGIDNSQYHSVRTGIFITPHWDGDKVKIVLREQQQQADAKDPSVINTQGMATVLSVPLNTWIKIGGSDNDEEDDDDSVTYTSGAKDNTDSSLYLRVQLGSVTNHCQ